MSISFKEKVVMNDKWKLIIMQMKHETKSFSDSKNAQKLNLIRTPIIQKLSLFYLIYWDVAYF